MEKGIVSLDALLAFLLILFLVIFTQKATSMSLMHSDAFGASVQTQATAEKLGSVMNSFYATNPGTNDFIRDINDYVDIKFFGNYTYVTDIVKQPTEDSITVTITTIDDIYSSSYPVARNVEFDSSNGEVLS